MAQAQTHPHVTTWAGRKFYGEDVTLPTGVQKAPASNSAELQNAVNNPANIIIEVDGACDTSTVEFLPVHSGAGQKRYIVGKAGSMLARIVMVGALNWVFTADGTTTDWLNFGSAKGNYTHNGQNYAAGTVFGGITCVDVKDVVIDRWRFRDAAGFLTYYSTDGGVVENLCVQNGNSANTQTANPREGVLISRPSWCGEMIGGSGSTTIGPFWDVRSLNCRFVNNVSANAPDWFQNTGNGHVALGGFPGWAWSKQTGANSLSDEGLIIAGNQLYVDEYVYLEQGLAIRAAATENAIDLKNGSLDPSNPIRIFDNVFWGFAPGRGWGQGDSVTVPNGHLEDTGAAIAFHYDDCKNVVVEDNIFLASNREIGIGAGYNGALTIDHNLFYAGPATLSDVALYRFNNVLGQNADPFTIVLQDYVGGPNMSFHYNHIMHPRVAFSNNQRLGGVAPSCVGNVALGGAIGQLGGLVPQQSISDASGFGARVGTDVLGRTHDLSLEVRDPNDLDDPTATVTLYLPQALLNVTDSPTDQNRWVFNNEEPPGASYINLSLAGMRKSTEINSVSYVLQAGGGTAPYVYSLLGFDAAGASASITSDVLTINRGDSYGEVNATVRVMDSNADTASAVFTATFDAPQIPNVMWTSNSQPYPVLAPATNVNDGDTTFDGGWTGSTANGIPAILTGLWPVPHDVTLVRTMEALDDQRDYYRVWKYTTDGTNWIVLPEFGDTSTRKSSPLEWEDNRLTITGAVGLRRVATGNSQDSEWQRVTEVRLYGVPSVAGLTPPTCNSYTVSMGQGESIIITPQDIAALAATDGGDALTFDASPLSIRPVGAGTVSLEPDGNIVLTSAATFAGDISITCQVRASETA